MNIYYIIIIIVVGSYYSDEDDVGSRNPLEVHTRGIELNVRRRDEDGKRM
jgi:hypothetical protein